MKFIELSPKGNFESWEAKRLLEMRIGNFSNEIGQKLLFENTEFRLWEVQLKHKERLTFRKAVSDFSITCTNDGCGVIHIGDGSILFSQFKKGDVHYVEVPINEPMILDFENSGLEILKLILTEIKRS